MVLQIMSVGDNPQYPSIVAEAYLPDQLIAGNLKIVSDNVTLTGAAPLPRGTVVGLANVGSSPVATAGKAFASGNIVVAALPAAAGTDTLTVIGGAPIAFLPMPAGQVEEILPPNTQYILGTTALQAQALAAFLNASTDVNIAKATYSVTGSTITATSKIPGTGGNAYTLATNNSATFTVPANLSGGTNNAGTATIGSVSFGPAAVPGNYVITLTSATQGNVINPSGAMLGVATMGAAFVNPEINLTLTTGGSPAAGDAFVVTTVPLPSTGLAKLCVASAIDGSDTPYGILADYTDPSSGNVNAGIYTLGEFNQNAIVYDSSWTVGALKAAMRSVGLYLKTAVTAGDPS